MGEKPNYSIYFYHDSNKNKAQVVIRKAIQLYREFINNYIFHAFWYVSYLNTEDDNNSWIGKVNNFVLLSNRYEIK